DDLPGRLRLHPPGAGGMKDKPQGVSSQLRRQSGIFRIGNAADFDAHHIFMTRRPAAARLNPVFLPVVSGRKFPRRRLHYLAVKLYAIIYSTISTYYTDAIKSPLPCEGTTPGEGGASPAVPYPPHPALSPQGRRGK